MMYCKKDSVIDRMVLNDIQKEAVLYDSGPQLVFAGAGTGKTRVLTAKIAWLIENGIKPGQIFAATFTNKAAKEMRSRVESLINMPAGGLWIGTFHSMCARILRLDGNQIGYNSSFTIYDSNDQSSLIKKILKNLSIDDRSMPPRQVQGTISRYKNACMTPQKVDSIVKGFYDQEVLKVYKSYQKSLKDQQAMDFDDLLFNTVLLFLQSPQILEQYRTRFKYILVDEYQDTNAAQFRLIKLLSESHGHIFAVGDDDQSIYGWRGAQIENILSFENEFPATKIFKLEQNYRSTKSILDFANAVIAENTVRAVKSLWTERKKGDGVSIVKYRDDRQEAESIAEKISATLSIGKVKGSEIAILFRTNAQSRSFEDALRKKRIAYVLVGGMSFYERAEIKDCLAYLRLLVNQKDDISFDRICNVPARGLGDKAKEALQLEASKIDNSELNALLGCDISTLGSRAQKGFKDLKELFELLIDLHRQKEAPHEILNQMLQLSGYMDMLTTEDSEEAQGRIENINELGNAMAIWSGENQDKGLAEFLEEVTLVSDIDSWEQREAAVNLMTLHCAKGLEFRHVYLVGIEDGIIPSRQNFDDVSRIEEERRLLYVGSTRAMEMLECSHAKIRWRFGEILPSIPSRFIDDIPEELFTFVDNSSYSNQQPLRQFPVERKTLTQNMPSGAAVRPVNSGSVQKKPIQEVPKFDDFSQDTVEFRMGQYVRHKTYGRGRILSISGFGDDMRLTVLFNNGQRLKLMAKFANLD